MRRASRNAAASASWRCSRYWRIPVIADIPTAAAAAGKNGKQHRTCGILDGVAYVICRFHSTLIDACAYAAWHVLNDAVCGIPRRYGWRTHTSHSRLIAPLVGPLRTRLLPHNNADPCPVWWRKDSVCGYLGWIHSFAKGIQSLLCATQVSFSRHRSAQRSLSTWPLPPYQPRCRHRCRPLARMAASRRLGAGAGIRSMLMRALSTSPLSIGRATSAGRQMCRSSSDLV